mmetsp:Transcript_19251/g.54378  ORF Transcript_19251/g.54378 Transcript_19251/m.54378 type:complete len:269 (+) Transcript_19251:100-906(+)
MPLVRLLGEELLAAAGKAVQTRQALAGASVVGVYFSASWCPPCRNFTPMLAESYAQHLKPKGFECVLVSSDRSEEDFLGYFAKMPWLALPYGDRARQEALSAQFGVRSIPTLALVDAEGRTITTEAREALPRDREGRDFPWRPPAVRDLALGAGRINEVPALVCLSEAAGAAEQHQLLEDLTEVAGAWQPTKGDEYAFFVASGGPLTARIREICGLPAGGPPQLLLLDIPDRGGFYLGAQGEGALAPEAARALLGGYEAGSLERRQLA